MPGKAVSSVRKFLLWSLICNQFQSWSRSRRKKEQNTKNEEENNYLLNEKNFSEPTQRMPKQGGKRSVDSSLQNKTMQRSALLSSSPVTVTEQPSTS